MFQCWSFVCLPLQIVSCPSESPSTLLLIPGVRTLVCNFLKRRYAIYYSFGYLGSVPPPLKSLIYGWMFLYHNHWRIYSVSVLPKIPALLSEGSPEEEKIYKIQKFETQVSSGKEALF